MKKQRVKQLVQFSQIAKPLEEFEFETVEEIDNKFNQLLQEAENETIKLVTVEKSKQRRLAFHPQRQKSVKDSQLIELSSYDGEKDSRQDEILDEVIQPIKETQQYNQKNEEFYKFFVDRYFSKGKKEIINTVATPILSNDVNFLVQRYGDFLQNSLMSSLIIETLKQKYPNTVPTYDHFGTAQKILQSFNISAVTLCNLKTGEERQNYLISNFQNKCEILMSEWNLKIAKKDKQLQLIDQQFTLAQVKNRKQQNDLFQWLTLKSKYQVLQKKLREMLMEKINEYENQLKIAKAMQSNKKIKLTGIPKISTFQVLQQNNQINETRISQEVKWNPELEKRFQNERKLASKNYNLAIDSSNYNQLAFMQIFDEVKMEDPIYLQRDSKMEKYMNGDWLTPQEMKFLANTSELLNKCVDKKQVQGIVSRIKQNQIVDLENYLAQQIIQNHQSLRNQLQNARSKWLKEQIEIKKKIIKQTDIDRELKQYQTIQVKQHYKKVKKLERICKKMEENISIKDQVYRNFFALIFVRKIIQQVEYLRYIQQQEYNKLLDQEMKDEKDKVKKHKERIIELSKPFSIQEDKRRKYHPSSKLGFISVNGMTAEDWESNQGKRLKDRLDIMKQKEQDFKLGILSVDRNKKDNFTKFYSSGPNRAMRFEPIFDPSYPNEPPKLSEKELQSIIKIQHAIRKHIAYKKLKNYKELFFQKKLKIYNEKLINLKQDKNFTNKVKEASLQLQTSVRIKTLSRIKSEISLKGKSQIQKTEETAEPSFGRAGRLITTQNLSKVKQLLVKHERLLRYSKLNQPGHIIKSGFAYTQNDIDVTDYDGNTALYYSAIYGNSILVDFLLKHGANPNVMCSDGTPMHMAVKSNKLDIIFLLLNNGGSLDIQDQNNCTPLIHANDQTLKQLGMYQKGIVSSIKQNNYNIKNDQMLYSKEFQQD